MRIFNKQKPVKKEFAEYPIKEERLIVRKESIKSLSCEESRIRSDYKMYLRGTYLI